VWRSFVLAWQFLTILPAPYIKDPSEAEFRRSALWLPFIGLGLGAILAGLRYALAHVLPIGAATFIALTVYTICTGALHVDGLMDTADAIGSRKPRELALDIMKDSRVGAMGAIAAVLSLAGKWIALSAYPAKCVLPLLLVPLFSRLGMVWAMLLAPAARPNGLGAMFARQVPPIGVGVVSAIVAIGCIWLIPLRVAITLFCAFVLLVFLFTLWMRRRFGGMTGDTYGALAELIEWVLWFVMLALFAWRMPS
jgi:adenosylcobinamide-GDP ribazoletransferase